MEDSTPHYKCGHCGAEFDSAQLEPRCPKCLRISKIQPDTPSDATPEATPVPQKNAGEKPEKKGFPWLPVGVAMMATAAVAGLTLTGSSGSLEESLAEATIYALLGGTGLGFVAIAYLKSRKNSS